MPTATQLRSDIAALSDVASDDLATLWRGAETADQVETALRDLLPSLIDAYGSAAAAIAADWYDDLRDAADVPGRFSAIPAEIPETGTHALIGWALAESKDMPGFQGLLLGGTQRRIANFSRLTVSGSAVADPSARGWMRVGAGRCDFCRMLIGRGAVYTEATADFEAHDHCGCAAAPEWR